MSAKKASEHKEGARSRRDSKESKEAPRIPMDLLGNIAAVLCAAGAFVGIVFLYRYVFPPAVEAVAPEALAVSETMPNSPEVEAQPTGVEDPWYATGVFTTGSQELDEKIKAFCDSCSEPGNDVEENAHNAYNAIVWSGFSERAPGEEPSGLYWASVSALHYFSNANPDEGVVGAGDVYDYAAALAYCLRYFGFYDAIAVPTAPTVAGGEGSAVCVVTGVDGYDRVCVPELLADGWMLDRHMYTIVVEDIGQDLTQARAMGLEINEQPKTVSSQTSVQHPTQFDMTDSSGSSTGEYDQTGTDQTGVGQTGIDQTGADQTGADQTTGQTEADQFGETAQYDETYGYDY